MNKIRTNIFPLFCFGIAFLFLGSYHLFFENEIQNILNGETNTWSNTIIHWFYPRLAVERHRFSQEFFLAKTHDVFYRGFYIFLFFGFLSLSGINNNTIHQKWMDFWNQTTTKTNIKLLNKIYLSFLLLFTWDLGFDIYELQAAAESFYQPVFILKLLHIGFPTIGFSILLLLVFYGSIIWSLVKSNRKWTMLVSIVLFIYFESLLNSFEKVDHGLSTFIYGGIGLFLTNLINQHRSVQLKWPILLTQLWIALCYLFAGIEKVTTTGFDWVVSHSLQGFLVAHGTPVGIWLAQHEQLCTFVMILTLFFQFGFISIVFNKKSLLPVLFMGVCFHWGTTLFLGINQFINPWVISYIFFIDWDKVVLFISKKTTK